MIEHGLERRFHQDHLSSNSRPRVETVIRATSRVNVAFILTIFKYHSIRQ